MLRSLLLCIVMFLAACSSGDTWDPAPQSWQDLSISLQTRPSPVHKGMNEFLVIASRPQHGFTSDLMVDIRTDSSDWIQAIPDGALGVYRRALPVTNPDTDHLFVRLTRHGQKGELTFALSPHNKQK